MSDRPAIDDLCPAYQLLKEATDISHADTLEELVPAAIYKTSVALWLLLFQRLNPNASLRDAVLQFVKTAPGERKTDRRLREGGLSSGSSSSSSARHRINLETVRWFEQNVSSSIVNSVAPSFNGQRLFLIDGATFTLAPVPQLKKHYPPASSKHGDGALPVAYVLTAHELSSGAAVPPEIGAMHGPSAVSETHLARSLIQRLPANAVVMADTGYGIYSVAHHAHQCDQRFVLRLTKPRFNSIKKNAELVSSNATHKTYQVQWTPAAKELAHTPEIPADGSITARLHELKIGNDELFIIENIVATPTQIMELHSMRNDAEVDIRNLKLVLGTEDMPSKSQAMFLKQFSISMVAYNLTTQLRRQAAALAKCGPRELSFTGVWSVYRHMLQGIEVRDPSEWHAGLEQAIKYAAQQKLPRRPGRSHPQKA